MSLIVLPRTVSIRTFLSISLEVEMGRQTAVMAESRETP